METLSPRESGALSGARLEVVGGTTLRVETTKTWIQDPTAGAQLAISLSAQLAAEVTLLWEGGQLLIEIT